MRWQSVFFMVLGMAFGAFGALEEAGNAVRACEQHFARKDLRARCCSCTQEELGRCGR